jgi:hypothetical protein
MFQKHSCKSLAKYLLFNLVQHLPDVVDSCGRLLPLLLLHGLVLPLHLLLRLHAHHHCCCHSRGQAHLGEEPMMNTALKVGIVQPFELGAETSSIRCENWKHGKFFKTF